MSVLQRVVWINDIVVPVLVILCNILLLWLIKTVNTKTLIHINYSLVPNCFIDILTSIATFIVAPHIFHREGLIYIVFGDLFGSLNPNVACHIASIFVGLMITSIVSITVSFYVRYLVICRGRVLFIRVMILPYFILFIIFLIIYLLFLWFFFSALEYTKNVQGVILKNFWKQEFDKNPLYFANETVSPSFLCNCTFSLLIFISAYSCIFFYSYRISKTLKTHVDSNQTKLLHSQIQRALLIQAIVPSLIGCLPLLLILSKGFLRLQGSDVSMVLSLFFPWMSIPNPIAAFIFIKPYRNKMKSMFKTACKPFSRTTVTTKIIPSQNN